MHQTDVEFRQGLRQRGVGLDRRFAAAKLRIPRSADTPNRPGRPSRQALATRRDTSSRRVAHQLGDDGGAPGRQFVDGRRHRGRRSNSSPACAGSASRSSSTGAARCLFAQRQALADAEAVLLVDDHQAQIVETAGFLKQRVRADHELGGPADQACAAQLFPFLRLPVSHAIDAQRLQPIGICGNAARPESRSAPSAPPG